MQLIMRAVNDCCTLRKYKAHSLIAVIGEEPWSTDTHQDTVAILQFLMEMKGSPSEEMFSMHDGG